jgi:hypothetical protein
MQGMTPVSIISAALEKVSLPPLTRPPVGPGDDPTEELVLWAIKFYVESAIAHVRTVLCGLVELAAAGNIPTAFLTSRNLFEWTAQACYMSRNLGNYVSKKEWDRAWRLLSMVAMGNKWVKDHGSAYCSAEVLDDIPEPLRIANVVAAYDEYQRQQLGSGSAKDNYGLLSEYSHPNSVCMQQYHEYVGREVRFITPATGSPLPLVNWCLIDLMMFLEELLRIGRETILRPVVVSILKEMAALAPPERA